MPQENTRGHSELNQGPAGLQPDALPLSYIPLHSWQDKLVYKIIMQHYIDKKWFVRNGIRTHALNWGPEFSLAYSVSQSKEYTLSLAP